jgi:hypothetical protein
VFGAGPAPPGAGRRIGHGARRAARDLPVVISPGHADAHEVRLLVDEAVRLDLPRLMLNQPASPMTGLTCKALMGGAAAEHVWTEQTALTRLRSL